MPHWFAKMLRMHLEKGSELLMAAPESQPQQTTLPAEAAPAAAASPEKHLSPVAEFTEGCKQCEEFGKACNVNTKQGREYAFLCLEILRQSTLVKIEKSLATIAKDSEMKIDYKKHQDQNGKTQTPAAPTPPQPQVKERTVDDVKKALPDNLEALLNFEYTSDGKYVRVKPKQFLGSDCFADLANLIRGIGGEYISAGKDSHFRVPRKKA